MRSIRRAVALGLVLLAPVIPWAAPSPAGAGSETDNFGPTPMDCGALGRDYTDPTCLTQTRNGTFSLSPHTVHAGGKLSGSIGNRCVIGYGNDSPCPIGWEEMLSIGKRASGCGSDDSSCTVRIPKLAPTSRWRIVTVGITSAQGTGISKDYFATIGKGKKLLAGHVKDEHLKPVRNVKVVITGGGKREVRKTDRTGYYSAVLKAGRYRVTAEREGLKPVKSRDCKVDGQACRVYLIQDRTADFEVKAPLLLFKAKLGAKVRSQKRPRLIQAGTPFLIDVTLRNTSRDDRLIVWPIYGDLSGNASDGHLQAEGVPVRRFTPEGSIDEVRPSPYLVLDPKETRRFNVVVRTSASDAFADIGESEAGGTHAVVKFSPPELARVDREADLDTLDPNDLDKLDPARAVKMEDGSTRFEAGIDDSAPEPPPASALQATWSVTQGVVRGVWNVTWGTVRGLLWDLPVLALKGLASTRAAAFAYVQYEVELWEAIKDDPAAVAAFINPLTHATLIATREAPFLVKKTEELSDQINKSVSARYNQMSRHWYAGDWRQALTDMTAEGTEQLANVALALAPGILARLPKARNAWEAGKAAVYARVSQQLAAIVRPGATAAAQVQRAFATVMKAGAYLDDIVLEELYGISAKQAAWLRAYAKSKKLVVTFRSRAQASLQWLEKGARLKPSWLKVKTVNWYDVKYLGYEKFDIGRLVLRKPPSRVEFYKELYPKIPVKERAEAAKRWFQRSQEWDDEAPQLFKWHEDRKVTGKWPWQENLVNPAAQADEVTTTGFKLSRRPGKKGEPVEYIVEVEHPLGSGKFVSVTGDVDFLSITKANGQPLSDTEHIRVMDDLRKGPVGAEHPEAATWRAPDPIREKYGNFSNGGKCCPAQIGPDGQARAVQYNKALSFFKNPGHYRIWWDGGFFVPVLP